MLPKLARLLLLLAVELVGTTKPNSPVLGTFAAFSSSGDYQLLFKGSDSSSSSMHQTCAYNKQFIDLFPQRLYYLFGPLAARPVRRPVRSVLKITVVLRFSSPLNCPRPSSRSEPPS